MKEPSAPCLDCKVRYVGCHSKCDAYIDFTRMHNLYVQTISSMKQADYDMDEVEKQRFEKYYKQKHYNEKKGAYD